MNNGGCFAAGTNSMPDFKAQDCVSIALGGVIAVLALLCFGAFFWALFENWLHNEQLSYGLLIPPIVGYLIWKRKSRFGAASCSWWSPGFVIAGIGCALQILATRNGTLLLSGIAFILTLIGMTSFLWGLGILKICAGPLALLILMVPLPSYVAGQVTWRLQSMASSLSGGILELVGVPVVQDGNLLRLPNYVLEVKQACSGSNSVLSLVALAFVIGLSSGGRWWGRTALVVAAPVLAIGANVIRIVGTGLIARQWGNLAGNESLHAAWGLAAFFTGVLGLLGINGLFRKKQCELA